MTRLNRRRFSLAASASSLLAALGLGARAKAAPGPIDAGTDFRDLAARGRDLAPPPELRDDRDDNLVLPWQERLLPLGELAVLLADHYDQWWKNPPAYRTERELLFGTASLLSAQWKLLNRDRTVFPDADLFAQRGDLAVEPVAGFGFSSALHGFHGTDPLPPRPDPEHFQAVPAPARLYLGSDTVHRGVDCSAVTALYGRSGTPPPFACGATLGRSHPLWAEGSPRDRFGRGVAVLVHDLAASGRLRAVVGDLHLRVALGPMADALIVDVMAYTLVKPEFGRGTIRFAGHALRGDVALVAGANCRLDV